MNGQQIKKPYHVQLADGRVMAMAGLYRPAQRNQPEQFVVVTTAADGNLAEIHHRSPAVLPQTAWSGWLSAPVHEALKLLSPPPAHYFNFYPVSSAVGRVSNDYPELVAPLTTSEEEAEKTRTGWSGRFISLASRAGISDQTGI